MVELNSGNVGSLFSGLNERCWWFYASLLLKQVKRKVLFQMNIFLIVYFKLRWLQHLPHSNQSNIIIYMEVQSR